MAAYSVEEWYSEAGDMPTVLAAWETQLETLDSTTNPIVSSGVAPVGNDTFIAWMIYTN